MTKLGRKIGGILVLISGAIFLFFGITLLIVFLQYLDVMMFSGLMLYFIGAILTILGGILLFLDKWIGGFFPILVGSVLLGFFFVPVQLHYDNLIMPPLFSGVYLETVLLLILCIAAIVGGIIGIIFVAEEKLTIDFKLLKIIGGIVAFTGALLFYMACTFEAYQVDISQVASNANTAVQWVINMYLMVIAMTGAVLTLLRKRLGGILLILAGLSAILIPLFAIIINDSTVALMFTQYSMLWGYSAGISGFNLVIYETLIGSQAIYITIESLLFLAGGIIFVIADAKDKTS